MTVLLDEMGMVGRSPRLVVRVPPDLRARALRTCSARGTSVSAMVRTTLERYLDVVEDEPLPVPVRPPPASTVLLITERSRAGIEEAARGHGPPRPIP